MDKDKIALLRNLLIAYKNDLCERMDEDSIWDKCVSCDMFVEDSCDRHSACSIDWLLLKLEEELSHMGE